MIHPISLLLIIIGLAFILWGCVDWFLREPELMTVEPRWEVIPAIEGDQTIGYQVRWSVPDDEGRYHWVGHYYVGQDLSLNWCRHAAEVHADRWNMERRIP